MPIICMSMVWEPWIFYYLRIQTKARSLRFQISGKWARLLYCRLCAVRHRMCELPKEITFTRGGRNNTSRVSIFFLQWPATFTGKQAASWVMRQGSMEHRVTILNVHSGLSALGLGAFGSHGLAKYVGNDLTKTRVRRAGIVLCVFSRDRYSHNKTTARIGCLPLNFNWFTALHCSAYHPFHPLFAESTQQQLLWSWEVRLHLAEPSIFWHWSAKASVLSDPLLLWEVWPWWPAGLHCSCKGIWAEFLLFPPSLFAPLKSNNKLFLSLFSCKDLIRDRRSQGHGFGSNPRNLHETTPQMNKTIPRQRLAATTTAVVFQAITRSTTPQMKQVVLSRWILTLTCPLPCVS